MADLHKTKVSRAVSALEGHRFLSRTRVSTDRRNESFSLTKQGHVAFDHLKREATAYKERLTASFTPDGQVILRRCLRTMAKNPTP